MARPVGLVIGHDPAYTGPNGLAVYGVAQKRWLLNRSFNIWETDVYEQLAAVCGKVCGHEQRALYYFEADAFNSLKIAHYLGQAVGAVKGLLIDIHAAKAADCYAVSSKTWRKLAFGDREPTGRASKKAFAVAEAKRRFGIDVDDHTAEAMFVAWYGVEHAGLTETG